MDNAHAQVDAVATPRSARGLGPFTGRQLTLIIVTLLVVVGFPVGAFAVTGSSVFVTDATSGVHAKVDAIGNLSTAGVPRGSAFVASAFAASGGSSCAFFTPPAGKAAVLTVVRVATLGAAPTSVVTANVQVNTGASCAGTTLVFDQGSYSADNPNDLALDPGVTVASGHHVSWSVPGGAGDGFVEIFGYYVPSSYCTIAGNICY